VILWCYAIWWIVNVWCRFDARLEIWLTSIGLSGIVGFALLISTQSATNGTTKLDRWQIFRLFLMPFCVSSFAALVKGAHYVLIFPPTVRENAVGFGAIALFLAVVTPMRRAARETNRGAIDTSTI
jgi:hypothetical protein